MSADIGAALLLAMGVGGAALFASKMDTDKKIKQSLDHSHSLLPHSHSFEHPSLVNFNRLEKDIRNGYPSRPNLKSLMDTKLNKYDFETWSNRHTKRPTPSSDHVNLVRWDDAYPYFATKEYNIEPLEREVSALSQALNALNQIIAMPPYAHTHFFTNNDGDGAQDPVPFVNHVHGKNTDSETDYGYYTRKEGYWGNYRGD